MGTTQSNNRTLPPDTLDGIQKDLLDAIVNVKGDETDSSVTITDSVIELKLSMKGAAIIGNPAYLLYTKIDKSFNTSDDCNIVELGYDFVVSKEATKTSITNVPEVMAEPIAPNVSQEQSTGPVTNVPNSFNESTIQSSDSSSINNTGNKLPEQQQFEKYTGPSITVRPPGNSDRYIQTGTYGQQGPQDSYRQQNQPGPQGSQDSYGQTETYGQQNQPGPQRLQNQQGQPGPLGQRPQPMHSGGAPITEPVPLKTYVAKCPTTFAFTIPLESEIKDIIMESNDSIYMSTMAFIAATKYFEYDDANTKKTLLFENISSLSSLYDYDTKTGIQFMKITNETSKSQKVWFGGIGKVKEIQLEANEILSIPNELLIAFKDPYNHEIIHMGNDDNNPITLYNEGIFYKFTGPNTIYIQTKGPVHGIALISAYSKSEVSAFKLKPSTVQIKPPETKAMFGGNRKMKKIYNTQDDQIAYENLIKFIR